MNRVRKSHYLRRTRPNIFHAHFRKSDYRRARETFSEPRSKQSNRIESNRSPFALKRSRVKKLPFRNVRPSFLKLKTRDFRLTPGKSSRRDRTTFPPCLILDPRIPPRIKVSRNSFTRIVRISSLSTRLKTSTGRPSSRADRTLF